MKNKIIILLVFMVPIAMFAFLQGITKNSVANANSYQSTDKAKIIKFYSPMCSECKKVSENVKNVHNDYKDIIILEEINVADTSQKTKDLIEAYKVTVVPTVIFVDKQGKITNRQEGMIEEIEIRNNLDEIK